MNKKTNIHGKNSDEVYEKARIMFEEDNMSITKIAKELGVDRGTLSIRLKKDGVSVVQHNNRKYHVDNAYFDVIDTEEKAYWLGFLYADGYLSKSDHRIQLALAAIDKDHLEKFNQALSSNYLLYFKQVSLKGKIFDTYMVQIFGKQLHQSLSRLGCSPQKTFDLTFPLNKMPSDLYRHFIRGIFDGDGSLCKANPCSKNFFHIRISSGCPAFLKEINEVVHEQCGSLFYLRKEHTCWDLRLWKEDLARKFLNYIYEDATIFLDRKYSKYLISIMPSQEETPEIISAELSGDVVKPKGRLPEPKAS